VQRVDVDLEPATHPPGHRVAEVGGADARWVAALGSGVPQRLDHRGRRGVAGGTDREVDEATLEHVGERL
jgi:hypothetical protein